MEQGYYTNFSGPQAPPQWYSQPAYHHSYYSQYPPSMPGFGYENNQMYSNPTDWPHANSSIPSYQAAPMSSHNTMNDKLIYQENQNTTSKKQPKLEGDPGVLNNFILFTNSFIDTISRAFDDCPALATKKEEFETAIKPYKPMQELFCKKYHEQMKEYYDACQNKNPAPFMEEKIKILKEMKFKEKYLELTDDSTYSPQQIRENTTNLWEYILEMNKYARLYNEIPTRIVGKIENVALSIAKEITTGEKDFTQLDIFKIGQDVVTGASADEIGELMQNMGGIYKAVGGLDEMKEAMGTGVKMPSIPNLGGLIAMAQKGYVQGSVPPISTTESPLVKTGCQGESSNTTNEQSSASASKRKGWRAKPVQ